MSMKKLYNFWARFNQSRNLNDNNEWIKYLTILQIHNLQQISFFSNNKA